jgi:hypothetical protein
MPLSCQVGDRVGWRVLAAYLARSAVVSVQMADS